MTLAPALGPISGIWTGLVTAADRADGTTVHDRPRPINLVGAREPVEQCKVHQIPNARPLPIAQAPPACHPRPAPEFLREHLPGNSAAKDEDDARQARAIRNAWSATLWPPCKNRQEGFDEIPQPIWKQRRGHAPFTLLRRRRSGSVGFVTRSKAKIRNLNEIECFVKAVQLKSLTAAAKALKLPKSSSRSKIKNL